MERYKLVNDEKINNILLYIIIFTTIIFSRDTLITSVKLGFYKSFFIYLVIILIATSLILINIIKNKRIKLIKIRKKPVISIFAFVGIIIFTSIIKLDFQMYIVSIIFYIFVACLFIMIFTFEDFFKKFSNIMVFLSIVSLVMIYLFRDILLFPNGVLNNNINIISNSEGANFFDFGLSYVIALPYYIRNFGIFREPGVYQFFLLVPFIYEILIKKNNIRYFNIIILAVTIISTFSLAGIIIMALVIFTYIVNIVLEREITKKLIIYIISIVVFTIGVIILLYVNSSDFSSIINESFHKLTTVNQSSSARVGSLINNAKLFLRSPIWGHDFSVIQYASLHNTNSTISTFAIFGIFAGMLHVRYLYKISEKASSKKIVKALLVIIFLLLVNSQFLIGNTMFWIFIFSSFMIQEEDNNENEEFYIEEVLKKISLLKVKIFSKDSEEI